MKSECTCSGSFLFLEEWTASFVHRWVRHPWPILSTSAECCHCLSCYLLFTWSDKLLVQSYYRGCTQAVYLCIGLCHCHSHSHACYLLIVHIPICAPLLPTSLLPLLLCTDSVISHYALLLSFFTQVQSLDSIEMLHGSGGNCEWPEVPLSLRAARRDRCMLVCSDARGGKGWVYLCQHASLPTSRGIQMSLLLSPSCHGDEVKRQVFFADPELKKGT